MIEQGQPEDLNWSISRNATMPHDIERRLDEFHGIGSLAGVGMMGDWYVMVPRVYSLDRIYEVHFVATHKGPVSTLVVNLREETFNRRVTRSVPLLQASRVESGD
jgi:hypothetical protein